MSVRITYVLALALALTAGFGSAAQAKLHGVVPDVPTGTHLRPPAIAHAASLSYGGGPVLHSNRTHLIFWEPAGSGLTFDPGYESLVKTFLAQVAADSRLPNNVYGLSGQYTDGGGSAAYDSTYAGAVVDTAPLPPNGCTEPAPNPFYNPSDPNSSPGGPGWSVCLTDAQLQAEITRVVQGNHLPSTFRDIYFLLTPRGFGDCQSGGPDYCALGGTASGYCGYHSSTGAPGILYAVLPYNAVFNHCQSDNPRPNSSTADPTISTLSHEHNETVTDPLGTGWIDSQGNENGDLCASDFGAILGGSDASAYNQLIHGGRYYLQEEYSNNDGGCVAFDETDPVWLAAAGRVIGDRRVSFAAAASDPDGSIARYDWTFGDGNHRPGQNVRHAFGTKGSFFVFVRTIDSVGNYSFAARVVRVSVPPRPVAMIAGPTSRGRRYRRVRLRFSSDAAIVTFRCRIDRGAWAPCRSVLTTPGLPAGRHVVAVLARDTFGQLSRRAARYQFTVA